MRATGRFDFEFIDQLSIPMQEWIIQNYEVEQRQQKKI